MNFFWVWLGGSLGALLRYLVYRVTLVHAFPVATLLINVLGSLVAGLAFAHGEGRYALNHPYFLFLVVGVLGAFTTFSTFSAETWNLVKSGQNLWAAGNVLMNVGLSVIAFGVGRLLMK